MAVVLHSNHANEIDDSVRAACARLRAAGATLLNQSVLLRGVNDSVSALSTLSQRLFEAGVVPYYLHLLDRVRGAGHFEVPEPVAQRLVGELACDPVRVPGATAGPRGAGRARENSAGHAIAGLENVRPVARARPCHGCPHARC